MKQGEQKGLYGPKGDGTLECLKGHGGMSLYVSPDMN